jgi:zinc transport system ATP-binding protein
MSDVITLTGGNITLAGRPVLRGIELSAKRGEVVAVLGSNGSGKSTLVRGLMGLVPWAAGEVRLFDTPLSRFRDWHRVGYVPQRVTASSGVPATVAEVVASGRLSRRRLLLPMSSADRKSVHAAIGAVELSDKRHDAVSQLSGGQQQRVLIARALASEPELFVLDEPNAGVDHRNQVGLAETLRPLVRQGATVVLVLHELGPLSDLIDRAILLVDGRIGYDGPPPRDGEVGAFHDQAHHHLHPGTSPRVRPDHVPMDGGWPS